MSISDEWDSTLFRDGEVLVLFNDSSEPQLYHWLAILDYELDVVWAFLRVLQMVLSQFKLEM